MGLSFTIAAGPRQRSQSQVQVPRTHIFYCLKFETPPTWRATSPYIYLPGTGWSGYTPRHWVPSSSPPPIRGATVEVFKPASARGTYSVAPIAFLIIPRHGLRRQHRLFCYSYQLPRESFYRAVP
jgi:hypothetical protein